MNQLKTKELENRNLELEFRSYLMANERTNIKIIETFTNTIERLEQTQSKLVISLTDLEREIKYLREINKAS
jgi:hypothetical protein